MYVIGRYWVDHHIQSPKITSNPVTIQKNSDFFLFYVHSYPHRCFQHLQGKAAHVLAPCRNRGSVELECLDKHRKQCAVLKRKTKTPQQLLFMWLGPTVAKLIISAQWSGATRNLRDFPVSLGHICSFQLQSLAAPHRKAKMLHKLCFMERNTSFCTW